MPGGVGAAADHFRPWWRAREHDDSLESSGPRSHALGLRRVPSDALPCSRSYPAAVAWLPHSKAAVWGPLLLIFVLG